MIRTFLLAACLMIGAAAGARAQTINCTLPVLLQNGTVADANQVMSNFNAVSGCVNTVSITSSSIGNQFDIANYGAVGDSVTDDSQHIANAFTACGAAGAGTVIVKPSSSGKMYVIQNAGLIKAAWSGACGLKFIGGHYWPANFYDNTPADWAVKGAWWWCQDASNSCAEMSSPGQSVIGGNFWYTHTTPTSTTCSATPCLYGAGWSPTVYPPTITADATTNFYKIQDNMIVNAYDCLDIEGPSSGVANMNSIISDNYLGCLHKDIKFNRVDNVLNLDHNHEFLLWYQGSTQVLGYVETVGGVGWDVNYLANLEVNGGEITWKRIGILLTDQNVVNGFGSLTFAGANWRIHGLEIDEVCRAAAVASGTTHFAGGPAGNAVGANVFSNIYATVDTQTSGTPAGGSSATVTISIASPAVISWTGHGLSVNQGVAFSTTGALPTGITAGTAYYVIAAGFGPNAFEIAATPGGAAINTTGSQSGTQTGTTAAPQCAAATPNLFDFGSDNVSVIFNGLNIGYANTIVNIGNGTSGFAEVIGARAQQYSVYTAGLPAFKAQTNAILDLIGDQFSISGAPSAGPYNSGGVLQPLSMAGAGNINGPAGTTRQLTFGSNPATATVSDFGSSYRWGIRGADSTAESGSNAGSNFDIDRYNDSGVVIDQPIFINRATGQVFIEDGLKLTLPSTPPSGVGAGYICLDSLASAYTKASCP